MNGKSNFLCKITCVKKTRKKVQLNFSPEWYHLNITTSKSPICVCYKTNQINQQQQKKKKKTSGYFSGRT